MKTLATFAAVLIAATSSPAETPPPPEKAGSPEIQKSPDEQKRVASYNAGHADGYMVGKTDAVEGRPRDAAKARRLADVLSRGHEGDQASYARGYREGYGHGWDQRKAYKP